MKRCPVKKDLDKRRDVLNKSLLRSLKKYLTNMFNEYTGFMSKDHQIYCVYTKDTFHSGKFLLMENSHFYSYLFVLELTSKDKEIKFKELLRNFVSHMFGDTLIGVQFSKYDAFEDILHYVGIMINSNLTKHCMRQRLYVNFISRYYGCIYKYTNKKFSKLFEDNILEFIFNHYVNTGAIYQMIETDET